MLQRSKLNRRLYAIVAKPRLSISLRTIHYLPDKDFIEQNWLRWRILRHFCTQKQQNFGFRKVPNSQFPELRYKSLHFSALLSVLDNLCQLELQIRQSRINNIAFEALMEQLSGYLKESKSRIEQLIQECNRPDMNDLRASLLTGKTLNLETAIEYCLLAEPERATETNWASQLTSKFVNTFEALLDTCLPHQKEQAVFLQELIPMINELCFSEKILTVFLSRLDANSSKHSIGTQFQVSLGAILDIIYHNSKSKAFLHSPQLKQAVGMLARKFILLIKSDSRGFPQLNAFARAVILLNRIDPGTAARLFPMQTNLLIFTELKANLIEWDWNNNSEFSERKIRQIVEFFDYSFAELVDLSITKSELKEAGLGSLLLQFLQKLSFKLNEPRLASDGPNQIPIRSISSRLVEQNSAVLKLIEGFKHSPVQGLSSEYWESVKTGLTDNMRITMKESTQSAANLKASSQQASEFDHHLSLSMKTILENLRVLVNHKLCLDSDWVSVQSDSALIFKHRKSELGESTPSLELAITVRELLTFLADHSVEVNNQLGHSANQPDLCRLNSLLLHNSLEILDMFLTQADQNGCSTLPQALTPTHRTLKEQNLLDWAGPNFSLAYAFMNICRHLEPHLTELKDSELQFRFRRVVTSIVDRFVNERVDTYSPEILRFSMPTIGTVGTETLNKLWNSFPNPAKLRLFVQAGLGAIESGQSLPRSFIRSIQDTLPENVITDGLDPQTQRPLLNLNLKELARVCMYVDKYNSQFSSQVFGSKSEIRVFFQLVSKVLIAILEGRKSTFSWVFADEASFVNFILLLQTGSKMCVKAGAFLGQSALEAAYDLMSFANSKPNEKLKTLYYVLLSNARNSEHLEAQVDEAVCKLFSSVDGINPSCLEYWINLTKKCKNLPKSELLLESFVVHRLTATEFDEAYQPHLQIQMILAGLNLCKRRRPATRIIEKLMEFMLQSGRLSFNSVSLLKASQRVSVAMSGKLLEDRNAAGSKLLQAISNNRDFHLSTELLKRFMQMLSQALPQQDSSRLDRESQKTLNLNSKSTQKGASGSTFLQSNFQRRVKETLSHLGLQYKQEVMVGGYRVDFLIEPNIVLEAVGAVHFSRDGELAAEETAKRETLQKLGFVVRFVTQDVTGGGLEFRKKLLEDVLRGKIDVLKRKSEWTGKRLVPISRKEAKSLVSTSLVESRVSAGPSDFIELSSTAEVEPERKWSVDLSDLDRETSPNAASKQFFTKTRNKKQ